MSRSRHATRSFDKKSFFHPRVSPTYAKAGWPGRMYVRPTTSYTSETSAAFQYDEKEVRLVPKKSNCELRPILWPVFMRVIKLLSYKKRKSYSPQSRPTKIRADHEPKRIDTIQGKPESLARSYSIRRWIARLTMLLCPFRRRQRDNVYCVERFHAEMRDGYFGGYDKRSIV